MPRSSWMRMWQCTTYVPVKSTKRLRILKYPGMVSVHVVPPWFLGRLSVPRRALHVRLNRLGHWSHVALTLRRHSRTACRRYGKSVPPDIGRWDGRARLPRLRLAGIVSTCTASSSLAGVLRVRLKDLSNLERVDVDVERMRLVVGLVRNLPLFGAVQLHGLTVDLLLNDLPSIKLCPAPNVTSPQFGVSYSGNVGEIRRERGEIAFVLDEILWLADGLAFDAHGEQRDRRGHCGPGRRVERQARVRLYDERRTGPAGSGALTSRSARLAGARLIIRFTVPRVVL